MRYQPATSLEEICFANCEEQLANKEGGGSVEKAAVIRGANALFKLYFLTPEKAKA